MNCPSWLHKTVFVLVLVMAKMKPIIFVKLESKENEFYQICGVWVESQVESFCSQWLLLYIRQPFWNAGYYNWQINSTGPMQALIEASGSIVKAIDTWRYSLRRKADRELKSNFRLTFWCHQVGISLDPHWRDKHDFVNFVHVFKKLYMRTVFVRKALLDPISENACQTRYSCIG